MIEIGQRVLDFGLAVAGFDWSSSRGVMVSLVLVCFIAVPAALAAHLERALDGRDG
jgi:hypothetical protein